MQCGPLRENRMLLLGISSSELSELILYQVLSYPFLLIRLLALCTASLTIAGNVTSTVVVL